MPQFLLSRATLIFFSSTLAVLGVACSSGKSQRADDVNHQISLVTDKSTVSPVPPVVEPTPAQTQAPENNYFEMGLNEAVGALITSKSAQSAEDWRVAASQYREAIKLMQKVPPHSSEFAPAQKKISEYRLHVKTALNEAKAGEKQKIVVTVNPAPNKPEPVTTQEPEVFVAPISRRIGGTPIVEVTFNNRQQFEMIVDTGASGTVITRKMADALGVVPTGTARANTASAKGVEFPIGRIDSMAMAGLVVDGVTVAIAGEELEMGLLGHDFFGNYDITIKRDVIEFRHR